MYPGTDVPEKPHEPALPSMETSPWPYLGQAWRDGSRANKVAMPVKVGRLGPQGGNTWS